MTWVTAFLGLFLLGAAWALAMPYDGPPDEMQHVIKAYAVAGGELTAPSTPSFTVPSSLVPPGNGCFRFKLAQAANCQSTPGAGGPQTTRTMVSTLSGAWSYNPVYYLLVGPVIHMMPTYAGVIVARLLNTALISALLASAMALVVSLPTGRWLLAGSLVVLTPVTVNLEGAVNAAGLEIAAGIVLWVSLIVLIDAEEISRTAIWLASISACLLAVLRGFGVGWLAIIAVFAVMGLSWRHLRALTRLRSLRIAAAVTFVVTVFGAIWDRYVMHLIPDKPTPSPLNLSVMQVFHLWSKTSTGRIYVFELWTRLPYYLEGMVGRTSYGDVALPGWAFLLWYAAVGALVFSALAFGSWRARLRIAGIIVLSLATLTVADVSALRSGFYLSQGRYALPLMLGAPLLAGYTLGQQKVLGDRQCGQLARAYILVLLPMQVAALWLTMVRFQRGESERFPVTGLSPLRGTWLPLFGPRLPLLLCAAGTVVIGALVWWWAGHSTGRIGSGVEAAVCEDPVEGRTGEDEQIIPGVPVVPSGVPFPVRGEAAAS